MLLKWEKGVRQTLCSVLSMVCCYFHCSLVVPRLNFISFQKQYIRNKWKWNVTSQGWTGLPKIRRLLPPQRTIKQCWNPEDKPFHHYCSQIDKCWQSAWGKIKRQVMSGGRCCQWRRLGSGCYTAHSRSSLWPPVRAFHTPSDWEDCSPSPSDPQSPIEGETGRAGPGLRILQYPVFCELSLHALPGWPWSWVNHFFLNLSKGDEIVGLPGNHFPASQFLLPFFPINLSRGTTGWVLRNPQKKKLDRNFLLSNLTGNIWCGYSSVGKVYTLYSSGKLQALYCIIWAACWYIIDQEKKDMIGKVFMKENLDGASCAILDLIDHVGAMEDIEKG